MFLIDFLNQQTVNRARDWRYPRADAFIFSTGTSNTKMMSQHYKSGNYVTTKKAENGCIVPVRKMGLTLWPYMSSVSKLTCTKSA